VKKITSFLKNHGTAKLNKRTTRKTVKSSAIAWIKQLQVTPSTMKGYNTAVKIINEYIGDRPAAKITALDLEELLNVSMSKAVLKDGSTGYKYKTKKNVRSVLVGIFTYLHKGNSIRINPCQHSLKISGCAKSERKWIEPYSKTDIQKLRAVADGSGVVEAALFAQYEGPRPSELIALVERDAEVVDNLHVLSISKAIVLGKLKETKTYLSNRRIALKDQSIPILQQMRNHRTEHLADHDYFFYNPINNQPWKSVDEFSRQLKKYFQKAGVNYRGVQPLRHTFVAKCIEAGIPIDETAKVLGHGDPQMINENYFNWQNSIVGKSYRDRLSNLAW